LLSASSDSRRRRQQSTWAAGLALVLLVVSTASSADAGEGTERVQRPAHAPADTKWYAHPAPGGHQVLVGVVRARRSGGARPPAVLLVPGTDGLTTAYTAFAHQLAAVGLDVGAGCWFADESTTPSRRRIACADGPTFKGVSDAAVPDLDALAQATKDALQTDRLVVVGFSRGGGIAMLRASLGADEPVVSVSGMLEGRTDFGAVRGEVDVVARATGVHVPVLLLHADADPVVPVQQARDMEQVLRAHGVAVTAKYYPGTGNGLADQTIRRDLVPQVAAFTCAHLRCPTS